MNQDTDNPPRVDGEYLDRLVGAIDGVNARVTQALAREVQASRKLVADLLAWLTKMDGGHCERTTGGGYYCERDGHTPDAQYGADMSCPSCNTHKAIRMIDEAGL